MASTLMVAAAPIPASDLLLSRHDSGIDFEWAATPYAATQPALLAQLRAAAQKRLAQTQVEVAQDRKGRAAYPDFHKHYFNETWERAGETPRLLVLTATTDSYSGGAHGMQGFDVAIWDKAADKRLSAPQLFTDWPKAKALLNKDFCKSLDEERKRRRDGQPSGLKEFDECPAIEKQTIVPSGGIQGRIVSLKVRIGPYEAGPYAEGSYEIEVMIPNAVIALVKPAYRAAFGWAND